MNKFQISILLASTTTLTSLVIGCGGGSTPPPTTVSAAPTPDAPTPSAPPEPTCESKKWEFTTLITGGGGMEWNGPYSTAAECREQQKQAVQLFRKMGLGSVGECRCS